MIPPQTPWYRQALAASHEAYVRVEVWRAGVQLDELVWVKRDSSYTRNVPVFFGGAVRATLASRVTRTLDLSVPEHMFPWNTTDLLAPYGNEIRAFRGIRYGSGTVDEFPVFVGPIRGATTPNLGTTTVKASDTALRVAGAGFESPTPSQVGDLVTDEYRRLVLDANPRATFGPFSPLTALVPQLSYDSDRGQALDSLAGAATANWYTLGDGRFVIRSVPWTEPLTGTPIVLADGPGGLLITATPNRSADGIYNQIMVLSDRPDGGEPLFATVSDTDPTSPTFTGGPFGTVSKQIRVTGASNQGQLVALARTELQRYQALTSSWQVTCVPDASIELGDPFRALYRGRAVVQFATSFSMPLEPGGTMDIQGRDLIGVDA